MQYFYFSKLHQTKTVNYTSLLTMHRACYCNACSIHPQISQKTFVSFPNELTALSFVILQRDLGAANIHPPRFIVLSGLGQTQFILPTLQHRCCVKCGDRLKEILFASNSFFLGSVSSTFLVFVDSAVLIIMFAYFQCK